MALLYLVFGICGFWHQVYCDSNNYEKQTLYRLYPTTNDQMGALVGFMDPSGQVEVLKGSRGYNDSMDVLVPASKMGYMSEFIRRTNVGADMVEDYGRNFDDPIIRSGRRMMKTDIYSYHSFDEMMSYIEALAQRLPQKVQLQEVGLSYQNRPMKLVKISDNPNGGNPVIFIDGGIHAREWVAPALALYIIHRLANDPSASRNELVGIDWYILPVVNPDGYEFSRSHRNHRMWRKTRSKNGDCYGVDANRNYGYKWAVSGVSFNPCHGETYAGPRAFSEPETRIVRDIMMANKHRIKLYVSLHSYGQYLVYPWGYSGDILPNSWKKLDEMARSVSEAVKRAGGLPFKVLSAGKWYPAAGGSDDFALSLGIPYSYTMELTDGFEFLFPEHLLSRVLPPFYDGFKEFATRIRNEFQPRKSGFQKRKGDSSGSD